MGDLGDGRGTAFGATVRTDAPAEHHWICPNCDVEHVTVEVEPHTPFHPCLGLFGLQAPLIPDRTKARIVAVVREDYIGGELVTTDGEGRPIMAVVTTRDDGEDRAVMAPTAQGETHGLD
jgi:hypothetical protein